MKKQIAFESRPKGMLLILGVIMTLLAMGSIACGVRSGDRSPARTDSSQTTGFHRSPVAAFEQFRMDLAKDESSCSVDPSEITVQTGQRVRLAIQLPTEIREGATKSLEVVGEKQSLTFKIEGLSIGSTGGAFPPTGVTAFDLEIESGSRRSYDFNPANTGAFDILCDGAKVGTFTVNPAA